MSNPVLRVEGLSTSFATRTGRHRAISGISFELAEGETLGLVGESGSGKSVLGLSIMQLLPPGVGRIDEGRVLLGDEEISALSRSEMRHVRGSSIGMIFQEPMTSLNPVFTCGEQISEVYRIHRGFSRRDARDAAVAMLDKVKIPAAAKRARDYPHNLSGGMRQRVMIAMALACRPRVLIADEPTTALDVTIQAQILELIDQLREEFKMAVLLVTHDLGVVAEVCDRVMVMYGGRIVEACSTKELFMGAIHPYSRGLLESIPQVGKRVSELPSIPGQVPALGEFPSGCRFANRCGYRESRCDDAEPALRDTSQGGHEFACWVKGDVCP